MKALLASLCLLVSGCCVIPAEESQCGYPATFLWPSSNPMFRGIAVDMEKLAALRLAYHALHGHADRTILVALQWQEVQVLWSVSSVETSSTHSR